MVKLPSVERAILDAFREANRTGQAGALNKPVRALMLRLARRIDDPDWPEIDGKTDRQTLRELVALMNECGFSKLVDIREIKAAQVAPLDELKQRRDARRHG